MERGNVPMMQDQIGRGIKGDRATDDLGEKGKKISVIESLQKETKKPVTSQLGRPWKLEQAHGTLRYGEQRK